MIRPHKRIIVWFRRDLRLRDNEALTQALADADEVVPVFVLWPQLLQHPTTGGRRVEFMLECLRELEENLKNAGSRLVLRSGAPEEEIPRLASECGATAVYFQGEIEPMGQARDAKVAAALEEIGIESKAFDGLTAIDVERIRSGDNKPYTVYSPFWRKWQEVGFGSPLPAPGHIPTPNLPSLSLPSLGELGFPAGPKTLSGGESEGRRLLNLFLQGRVYGYSEKRDSPAIEGTSQLSAHLKFGAISARTIVWEANKLRDNADEVGRKGVEKYISEVAWRDFYYQILRHFPHVENSAFRPEMNALDWQNDEALFSRWCNGQTGYPIVDAGMRQLLAEGWMHNRVRMIVASFLTKDLLISWQWGERHFMKHLVDGDLASNNGGWQWASSTGTDAQPYFRIFNPTSQGNRFDPDGAYVKRYIPELARVPASVLHSPWQLSPLEQEAVGCVLGKDYPRAVVDHSVQRDRALEMFQKVKS